MNKSVEDYLKILYPNPDLLDDEGKKQLAKDTEFLTKYLEEFKRYYQKFLNIKESNGIDEAKYTRDMLNMFKEEFDPETIIVSYVKAMNKYLARNPFISSDFETFMKLMYFEREQEEQAKNQPLDRTPIELETVFTLTEEFLSEIDESQQLVTEFRYMRNNGGIEITESTEELLTSSSYNHSKIIFAFDGTVKSAKGLVHEFMHHWTEIQGSPKHYSHDQTMLLEFLTIYYENAFIKYMNGKGILKYGEEPLKATRLQYHYSKDPDNSVLMLLELCQKLSQNGTIDKDSIINMLGKHMPDIRDREELWQKGSKMLVKFCNEHTVPRETIAGHVMYRLDTALVMHTGNSVEKVRNIYKLAPFILDADHDSLFIKLLNENRYTSMPIAEIRKPVRTTISTVDIGKRTVWSAFVEDLKTIGQIFTNWLKERRLFKE